MQHPASVGRCRHCFKGVDQKVRYHLLQLAPIAVDVWSFGNQLDARVDVLIRQLAAY
jgi:hypothetical protein